MKKLRWRLFANFAVQFFSVAILMIITILLTLFIAIYNVMEDESEHNYFESKLENIAMDTSGSLTNFQMRKGWSDGFEKEGIWVQVINEEGLVIDSGNVPKGIPNTYSKNQLEEIKQTKELNGYSLYFYLETFYRTPYLFILGYRDQANSALKNIVLHYNQNGTIKKEGEKEVEKILEEVDGSLEIYNGDDLIAKLGKDNISKEEKPLDVFLRDHSPNLYSTKRLTYHDSDTGNLWVLYAPNKHTKVAQLDSIRELIFVLVVTGAVVLLITILISVWNGFRYGNPLFIFTNWLSRMGNEQYDEVLTLKEKKHFYRRNGKIKRRYRLYEEVFLAFYSMAEKLDASRKEREQLEKTRQEWMSGISHDLRTPLSTMQGYGNLLESGQYEWSVQELKEIGQTIREKSDYMLHLIEDFSLNFQLKNAPNEIVFEKVEVNQFFAEIVGKFIRDMTLSEYPITFQPLDQPEFLPLNKRLFERMIDNLIFNAIKHNPAGTNISVVIEKDKDQMLTICIQDNGIGIDQETLKYLFSRYYRGTNTDERSDGTGLGMSIAKQIAELHKGTISVESEKNKGTTVMIQFLLE